MKASIHLLKYLYATKDLTVTYSGIRGQLLPQLGPGTNQYTTHLNHYASSHYGGKVYQTVTGEVVDRDHYRIHGNKSKNHDPALVEVDDDGKLTLIDRSHALYTDASFMSTFDYKSVSGSCIFYAGAVVDWGSHTSEIIPTSTMEAEIMATQKAVKKMLQVRTLLEDLQEVQHDVPTVSWQDNKATKIVLNNPSRRKGSQHIGRTVAKAQQWVDAGLVTYLYCRTNEMVADVFTKPLAWDKFSQFRQVMMNLADHGPSV